MKYNFPHITHLDQVRPVIQDVEGFILAEREWGWVANYVQMGPHVFPEVQTEADAIRRECRGLIFCPKTERIVRRPLSKFFNVGERDETQLNRLNFGKSHSVYTKEDGSMIVPFEVVYGSGIIRWGTKMGLTDVALKAEEFVSKNPKYQKFAKECIARDISPIFEYVAPDNRIVLKYEQESMILLAARHMITGEYLPLKYTS